jgi:hypothetical protein
MNRAAIISQGDLGGRRARLGTSGAVNRPATTGSSQDSAVTDPVGLSSGDGAVRGTPCRQVFLLQMISDRHAEFAAGIRRHASPPLAARHPIFLGLLSQLDLA